MNDWITYVVELYPKTRMLGEHLNRKEYDEAYMLAVKIEADMRHLREWINGLEVTGVS